MSNALSVIAKNTGASEEDIKTVLSGMIISAKNQHGSVASNAEMAVVTGVCSKYGLNPLVKECAAFISGGKLSVVVMIDGWYKIVNRQPSFDGVEFEDHLDANGKVTAITCKMFIKDRSRPVCITEYLNECLDAKSSVWKRWPARMLRHKAYIQAARVAFGISEMIDDDEQSRIVGSNQKITQEVPKVDFNDIDKRMAECGDNESLNQLSVVLKSELEKSNGWESAKAKCIAMKITHKNRIDAMTNIEEAEFEEVVECEPDIPFNGEDEAVEFAELADIAEEV